MPISSETQLWLFAASSLVFVVWATHLVLSLRMWIIERTARAFRNAYIAGMIQAGMLAILLGQAQRTWIRAPFLEDLRIFVAPILTWMLLSGGIVALWTWSRPDRRW